MKIKEIREVQTLEQLLGLAGSNDLNVLYDIGYRGGYVAFYGYEIAALLKISPDELTNKVGAYCNYLGGGIRGSVCVSPTDRVKSARNKALIDELAEACRRAYLNAEDDGQDDGDDEDAYWNRLGTEAARRAGIESAY